MAINICPAESISLNMKCLLFSYPKLGLLMFAAGIIGSLGGKKLGIHPARVKNLWFPLTSAERKWL
ncbi:MAG: hypothetical protein LBQ01_08795, partial [Prevotellaceae bacterium]|nr:hypothetical protein [Prevotellaceae bacterium]